MALIRQHSEPIERWGLQLVEGTDTDEKPIVYSQIIDFYFEWPRQLFKQDLIKELNTTPLDVELGATSYATPAHGVLREDGPDWIKYFVSITTTLLVEGPTIVNDIKNDIDNEHAELKAWLRRVVTKLPRHWFEDRIWRDELADQITIILNLPVTNKEHHASPEITELVKEIEAFQKMDLSRLLVSK